MATDHSVTISFGDDRYAEDFITEVIKAVHNSTYKPDHISVTIDEQEVS